MEAVVPWQALIDLIEPYHPKTSHKCGRPPYLLATMLRIHLQQQWYSLSDPAMEEALVEVPTMRRFAGIDLISDRINGQLAKLDGAACAGSGDVGQDRLIAGGQFADPHRAVQRPAFHQRLHGIQEKLPPPFLLIITSMLYKTNKIEPRSYSIIPCNIIQA